MDSNFHGKYFSILDKGENNTVIYLVNRTEKEIAKNAKLLINSYREKVGMVFQQFNLFNNLTVLDNITLAPVHLGRCTKEEANARAMELLGKVGLEHKANDTLGC